MLPELKNKVQQLIEQKLILKDKADAAISEFEKYQGEVNNLVLGIKKYEKENSRVAEQMQSILNGKKDNYMKALVLLEEIKKEQYELKKEIQRVYARFNAWEKQKVVRVVREEKVVLKKKELKAVPKLVVIPKPEVKETAVPSAEEKVIVKKPAAVKQSIQDEAARAAAAQKQLASLALGKSYGNA